MKFSRSQNSVFETARAINIISTAQQLLTKDYELHQAGNEWRCKSISDPKHDNTVTCFYPESNRFFEFNTNLSGDVIDFVAQFKKISLLDAAKFLTGESGYSSYHISEIQKWQKELETKYVNGHKNLKNYPNIINYLHERKITDETIEKYKIGVVKNYDGMRISIPYFDQFGNFIYGVMRATEIGQKAKYLKEKIRDGLKFSQPLMFLDSVQKSKETLIIGEGVFDILSAVQEGYAGLCFAGGYAGFGNIDLIIRYAKEFKRIILCFDNDSNSKMNSGTNFTLDTANAMLQAGITNFYCVRDYGLGNKDLSDFYTNGGNIEELIKRAQSGVIFTVRSFTAQKPLRGNISHTEREENSKELKKFYSQLKESLKYDDDLMKECNDIFKENYSTQIMKDFTKEPTKRDVIDDTVNTYLKGKELFSFGSPRHKEFQVYDSKSGIFRRKNESYFYADLKEMFDIDEDIYVKATNEIFAKRYLKNENEYPRWNTYEGFNFKSKVFDYNTKRLLDHSSKYHFNTVADFDYDENAECPEFLKYLDEISNGNQSRRATFDDMLGYLHAPHNKGQSIFCLIGEGANGKGVLENVLKGIFDADNRGFVTDLNPDDLSDNNQKIRLEQSILNINSDCNSYVSKVACSNLKRASAGDTISGNKKFYDINSFFSRAKYIFGFNEQPKFFDTSFGMKRRLIFIKLEKKFDENPDVNLTEKLLKEKAGIWNYTLKCYYALKERNFQIRRCDDQDEMIRNFEIEGNEVAAYLADRESEIINAVSPVKTTRQLHDDFTSWLDETRNRKISMTQHKLTNEIKRLTGLEVMQITSGEERGRRAFDFTSYFEKRKDKSEDKTSEWGKIENEIKIKKSIPQETLDWAGENFIKCKETKEFIKFLENTINTTVVDDEKTSERMSDIHEIMTYIKTR